MHPVPLSAMAISLSNPLNLRTVGTVSLLAGFWLLYKIVQTTRARARTTKLPGPPAKSWLFGVSKEVFDGDASVLFENWAKQYGKYHIVVHCRTDINIMTGDIMHVRMFGIHIVYLNTLEVANDLLGARSATYSDRPRLVMANEV